MSVMRICQASINELGQIAGGVPGNQTGKELNISNWYQGHWTLCLRASSKELSERIAKAGEAGAKNKNIGYSQNNRNTLRDAARKANWNLAAIKTPCETDCSAFMSVCAEAAGVKMDKAYEWSNAPTTYDMGKKFTATGDFIALRESKYLTSTKYLRRGDVLVDEQRHTVMVLDDGECANGKNSEIIVNGIKEPIDRMLVGGRNYFQVRDLVEILNRHGCKIEVGNQGNIAKLTVR